MSADEVDTVEEHEEEDEGEIQKRKYPFVIVEFCGEQDDAGQKLLEIVNDTWTEDVDPITKRGICWFPLQKDFGKVKRWVKSQINPKSSWRTYDVEVLVKAADYDQAKRRFKRLCKERKNVESTNSDSEGNQVNVLSRKRASSILQFSSSLQSLAERSENDDDCSIVNNNLRRRSSSAPSAAEKVYKSSSPSTSNTNRPSRANSSNGTNLTQSRAERKIELKDHLSTLREKGKGDAMKSWIAEYLDSSMELWYSQVQDDIQNSKRTQQYDLGKRMDNLQLALSTQTSINNDQGPSPRMTLGVEFPLKTLEDFEKFEKMLDPKDEGNAANPDAALQKQEALKKVMLSIVQGTKDFAKNVKAIVGGLTKADVQEYYSGEGRKKNGIGKRNFSATFTFECMKEVLQGKYADSSEKLNFVTVTSEYLAGFGSRDGRSAKRKRGAQ